MAKTLYQSQMVKMGPVKVTVKSDVLQSKFKGKPPYVMLEIGGEDYNYSTENDECAEFFEGQKGRSFTVVAEGSRENALLTYVGEAAPDPEPEQKPTAKSRPPANPSKGRGAPPPAQQAAPAQHAPPAETHAAPPARPPKAPAETPTEATNRVKRQANRIANVWVVAYAAALYAKQQVKEQLGQEVGNDLFHGCVSTICIQLHRDGLQNAMPTGGVDADGFYAVPPVVGRPAHQEPSDNNGGAQ